MRNFKVSSIENFHFQFHSSCCNNPPVCFQCLHTQWHTAHCSLWRQKWSCSALGACVFLFVKLPFLRFPCQDKDTDACLKESPESPHPHKHVCIDIYVDIVCYTKSFWLNLLDIRDVRNLKWNWDLGSMLPVGVIRGYLQACGKAQKSPQKLRCRHECWTDSNSKSDSFAVVVSTQ